MWLCCRDGEYDGFINENESSPEKGYTGMTHCCQEFFDAILKGQRASLTLCPLKFDTWEKNKKIERVEGDIL